MIHENIILPSRKKTRAFMTPFYNMNTVDLVIFACLNFREFLFFFSSTIIITYNNISNSSPREIREN